MKQHYCGFHFDNTYLNLPQRLYTPCEPVKVKAPEMVLFNHDLATEMKLDFFHCNDEEQASLFAGNHLPEGAQPIAQAYAGHQFGHFALLGDGRAILWGEHVMPNGKRVDIQLKGSGPTPYSRNGDGRAALGPMLREYLISEAMHALGIPTTRALAVVKTGEGVMRQTRLDGAILTRIASSHIRVGTFEFAAAQQDKQLIETLMNYTYDRHEYIANEGEPTALSLLTSLMERQADLIVHWMRVGFIHGVMNTDNVAISGETIDYGPCAFMDDFSPYTVFSSIDHGGRYAYANQPIVTAWNIARFAEALLPLFHDDMNKAVAIAEEAVNRFHAIYQKKYIRMMRDKLGLLEEEADDEKIINDVLGWMHEHHADYTYTFHMLSKSGMPADDLYQDSEFMIWHKNWQERVTRHGADREASQVLMKKTNPAIIPRNHKVEEALDAAVMGDMQPFHALLNVLKTPYKESEASKSYQTLPPKNVNAYQTFCGT